MFATRGSSSSSSLPLRLLLPTTGDLKVCKGLLDVDGSTPVVLGASNDLPAWDRISINATFCSTVALDDACMGARRGFCPIATGDDVVD